MQVERQCCARPLNLEVRGRHHDAEPRCAALLQLVHRQYKRGSGLPSAWGGFNQYAAIAAQDAVSIAGKSFLLPGSELDVSEGKVRVYVAIVLSGRRSRKGTHGSGTATTESGFLLVDEALPCVE